jgi:hypothetical protein
MQCNFFFKFGRVSLVMGLYQVIDIFIPVTTHIIIIVQSSWTSSPNNASQKKQVLFNNHDAINNNYIYKNSKNLDYECNTPIILST